MKCALCLPHCPTYLKLSNEADSPRGRIALIQAFIAEELSLSAGLQRHLDRCLGCRACERACPSGVAFGALIDGVRSKVPAKGKHAGARLKPWMLNILSDRIRLQKYLRALPPLLRRGHLLTVATQLAPTKFKLPLKIAGTLPDNFVESGLFPANRPSGKSLQLFIGCVSSIADQPAISAATQLLTRLGYAVEIPKKQACCGALHRHNGFPDEARQLCDLNRKQTHNSRSEALITLATACHLELLEHTASQLPVVTVTDFLLDLFTSQPSMELAPLSGRVAVHIPCSARADQTIKLLALIPQLEVFLLPENNLCCGAAGSYLLTQPELSNAFGSDKLTLLKSAKPDILITSNTGCAIQFRLQIKQAKLNIEVLHPVELINRQLKGGFFQT